MQLNFLNLEPYFDNFNICNIIKKIDKDYMLYFDKKQKMFVIINSAKNNQICLKTKSICPNIPILLQKTLVENSARLFDEIENHNKVLEIQANKKLKQRAVDSTVDLINFAKKTNKILQSDINKIKEGKYA